MSKRNALGRGLSSLLKDTPAESTPRESLGETTSGPAASMNEVLLSEIEVNPFQPRHHFDAEMLRELAESIKVHGIIQPLTLRRLTNNKYQIISGERRFQAARQAGLKTVPAYIRQANDQQMLEMALIENIQRENLNPIEIALSYQRLMSECNLKQDELGERVGKNRSTVTNYLRLLKLPPDIQIALRDNVITMGHARAIISVENADTQLYLFKRIIEEDLSVRRVEELVRSLSGQGETKGESGSTTTAPPKEVAQLQSRLSTHFGTKIQIKGNTQKGEIRIPYISLEELNRILDILKMG